MKAPLGYRYHMAVIGEFGVGNFGNDASLRSFLLHAESMYPGLSVRLLSPSAPTTLPPYVETSPLWPEQPSAAIVPRAIRKFAQRLLLPGHLARELRQVDVIVFPGTGLLEWKLGAKTYGLPWVVFCATLVGLFSRTPVALVGVGVSAPTSPIGRQLLRWTLDHAGFVSLRDETSRREAGAVGVGGSHLRVFSDLVFALPIAVPDVRNSPREGVRPRIAIGVMRYTGPNGETRVGLRRLQDYARLMSQFAAALVRKGFSVVFAGGDQLDLALAHEIAFETVSTLSEVDAQHIRVADVLGQEGLESVFLNADVVVCARYHNLIAAVRATRPAVSMSYADKSQELCTMMDEAGAHLPIDAAELRTLESALEEVHTQKCISGTHLESIRQRLVAEANTQFAAFDSWLAGESTPQPRRPRDGRWVCQQRS